MGPLEGLARIKNLFKGRKENRQHVFVVIVDLVLLCEEQGEAKVKEETFLALVDGMDT